MRIIDLLNKIANGEEVPKKIKFKNKNYNKEFYFDGDIYKYKDDFTEYAMTDDLSIEMALNDEVEVIEDNKKIEKLVMDYTYDIEEKIFYEKGDKPNHCIVGDAGTELLIDKINEIIDKLNELLNDKN